MNEVFSVTSFSFSDPLHAACRAGELGVVQSILEHTDPRLRSRSANLKDNDEWTPLHVNTFIPLVVK